MGIETTVEHTKESIVNRIRSIITMINSGGWRELYDNLNEDSDFKDDYVNEYNTILKEYTVYNNLFISLDNWPDKYLEKFMDKPGVRFSQFENYIIVS